MCEANPDDVDDNEKKKKEWKRKKRGAHIS